MTTAPDLAVTLARLEMKLDQILTTTGDHESRIRTVESQAKSEKDFDNRLRAVEELTRSGKGLALTVANTVMMLISASMAGTQVFNQ